MEYDFKQRDVENQKAVKEKYHKEKGLEVLIGNRALLGDKLKGEVIMQRSAPPGKITMPSFTEEIQIKSDLDYAEEMFEAALNALDEMLEQFRNDPEGVLNDLFTESFGPVDRNLLLEKLDKILEKADEIHVVMDEDADGIGFAKYISGEDAIHMTHRIRELDDDANLKSIILHELTHAILDTIDYEDNHDYVPAYDDDINLAEMSAENKMEMDRNMMAEHILENQQDSQEVLQYSINYEKLLYDYLFLISIT